MSASNLFLSPVLHAQETRGIVFSSTSSSDSGPVVPTTPLVSLLERLQHTALQTLSGDSDTSAFDPKSYVDMSLKTHHDLASVQSAFDDLVGGESPVSGDALTRFVADHFDGAGEDLVRASAGDFSGEPEGFLPRVLNTEVREWALEVHGLWGNLSRRVCDDALKRSDSHTLLPMTHRVIVPGSRFREVYYWDSYWIVRGLLASKMYESAKAIVANLISFVEQFGFVLNGARAYYTNRSQPPLLSAMVCEIFKRTKDVEFVRKSLPSLIQEHQFWTSGIHGVTIKDGDGCDQALSRYYAMWNKPRPESSTIDQKSASKITSTNEKKRFYREVASAAESGWDFSSRWMKNTDDFTTLRTTSILPVDLNAFILGMELNIVFLAKVLGENVVSLRFSDASRARKKAMESIFWNQEMGQWLDYCLEDNLLKEGESWDSGNQNHNTFASNFIPLWIQSFHSDTALVNKVMTSLQDSGLLCDYGIATSLTNSGEQWDFPNGWAPIQHMIIEGLVKSGSKEARAMAEEIAVRWIKTNYVAYKRTGTMHEKYNVEVCGDFGAGGEYVPQTGFGWSNGVVLALLEEFGWPEDRTIDIDLSNDDYIRCE